MREPDRRFTLSMAPSNISIRILLACALFLFPLMVATTPVRRTNTTSAASPIGTSNSSNICPESAPSHECCHDVQTVSIAIRCIQKHARGIMANNVFTRFNRPMSFCRGSRSSSGSSSPMQTSRSATSAM